MPASVYLPFVNNSIRNYYVLNIPPDEVRVFQTKERAPILLCVEIARPEEISFLLKPKNKATEDNDKEDQSDNPYL